MQSLYHVLFAVAVLCAPAQAQTYCQRGQGFLYDPQNQCFTSATYNIENCCFTCPVQNASGIFQFCGSLYELGFATCGQSGALAAEQAACVAIGGNINAGSFACSCNAGSNKSQSTGYVPTATAAPTAPTAPTSTAAPTSDASSLHGGQNVLLALVALFTVSAALAWLG